MNNIEIRVLNPSALREAVDMAACAARLTQGGHKIHNADDFMELYKKPYRPSWIDTLTRLPHPTLQKFAAINVVVVGASRRFLAQITRHQNEVKFMSASLQYSDYTGAADFAVPYACMATGDVAVEAYLEHCNKDMANYEHMIEDGIDHDAAGYAMPQGLRNVLIISATPYQWKHMISQRVCRRNTDETRIVMLKIWQELRKLCPELFSMQTTGPSCVWTGCKEGRMSCGKPIYIDPIEDSWSPEDILREDYPLLFGGT